MRRRLKLVPGTGLLLADRKEKASERRCIATGESGNPDAMVRFVVAPGGNLVPDVAGDLPGRGIWLCADRGLLEQAMKKRLFSRAAKADVSVPADLPDQVSELLRRRALDFLGLARRAGQAVAGFEKVREAIEGGKAAILIAASDGSPDGKRKLAQAGRGLPAVTMFGVAELSLAMGRENVVHAAIAPGRLARHFLAETTRLAGLRGATAPRREAGLE